MKLKTIFRTNRPLVGMIHFPPLIGYPEHPGFDYIAKKMLVEAKILETSGFDGIMIENNYDIPHTERVSTAAKDMFINLTKILQSKTSLPFGVSVLWNDYQTSLAICKSTKAKFFRVPAFVDTVKTVYGLMRPRAKQIVSLKKNLNLNHIAIFADIQVKHAQMINTRKSIEKSATQAIKASADAIIVTGKWTGDAPTSRNLQIVRHNIGGFPLLIGSGATEETLDIFAKYADGVIVGTAIKEGHIQSKSTQVNLKPFTAIVDKDKTLSFSKKFHNIFK